LEATALVVAAVVAVPSAREAAEVVVAKGWHTRSNRQRQA
jgi:hypothetical protein